MKKYKQNIFWRVYFLNFIFLLGVLICKKTGIKTDFNKIIITISIAIYINFSVVICVGFMCYLFKKAKIGSNNIRQFNYEPFDRIDLYNNRYPKDNNYYVKKLQEINSIYEYGLNDIIKNKNIELLFARKDYLEKRSVFYSEYFNIFFSFGISLTTSMTISYLDEDNNVVVGIISLIILIVIIVECIFAHYSLKCNNGSYEKMIENYELTILNEKILKLEKSCKENLESSIKKDQSRNSKKRKIGKFIKIKRKG